MRVFLWSELKPDLGEHRHYILGGGFVLPILVGPSFAFCVSLDKGGLFLYGKFQKQQN